MDPMLNGVRWPLFGCLLGGVFHRVRCLGSRDLFVVRMPRLWGPLPGVRLPGVWREERLRMDIGECSHRVGRGLCFLLGFLALVS